MKRSLAIIFILATISCLSQERKFNLYPNLAVDLGSAIPFPYPTSPKVLGVLQNHILQWD